MEKTASIPAIYRGSLMAGIARLVPYSAYRDVFPIVTTEDRTTIMKLADEEANRTLIGLVGDLNNFALTVETTSWLRKYQVPAWELYRGQGLGDTYTLADLVAADKIQICSTRQMYLNAVTATNDNVVLRFPRYERSGEAGEKLVEPLVAAGSSAGPIRLIKLDEIIRCVCKILNDMWGEEDLTQYEKSDEEYYQNHAVDIARTMGGARPSLVLMDGGK